MTITHSDDVDDVVLVSGDGDFDLLVDKLRNKNGKHVEVYGVQKLTSMSLVKAANKFISIDNELLLV